jgi:hypothetical protein
MAARTCYPRLPEFIHIYSSLLTFCFCEFSKAGEVDKSRICATARTIASQWLTIFVVGTSAKAQVAHRHSVIIKG